MNNNANLGFGLNSRKKRKKGLTSFSGGDGSDDDNNAPAPTPTGPTAERDAINRDIAAEQAALRKRAVAAMAASSATTDSAVYDYDAEYDSFSSGKKKEEADAEARSAAAAAAEIRAQNDGRKPKVQPRYIANLLQTAQRRNQEHEVIFERKVLKEQSEEDANLQYEGKEKFITSSYKRKLAERELWAKEEEERTKQEEAEDVTKKKRGIGNFMFGGIGRSMMLGGGGARESDKEEVNAKERGDVQQNIDHRGSGNDSSRDDYQRRDSSRETEPLGSISRNRGSRDEFVRRPLPATSHSGNVANKQSSDAQSKAKTRQQILEERSIKILEARERYFKRRGITTQ